MASIATAADKLNGEAKMACLSVAEDLACPVCLGGYQDLTPRVLSCLHTVCQTCLHSHIMTADAAGGDVKSISCPVCKKDTPAPTGGGKPPPDWAGEMPMDQAIVARLPAQMEEEQTKICDNCTKMENNSSPAVSYCIDCKQFQCDVCIENHKKFLVLAKHSIVSLAEAAAAEKSAIVNFGSIEYCNEHGDKKIEFFCQNDKALCCSTCAIVSHRSCASVVETKTLGQGLKDGAKPQSMRSKMTTLKAGLVEVLPVLESSICNIDRQAEAVVDKVKAVRDKMMQIFNTLVVEVSSKCEQLKQQQTTEVEDKISRDKALIAAISSSRVLLESVLKYGSETQVFIALQKLQDQLQHYDQSVTDARHRVSDVEFHLDVNQTAETLIHSTKPVADVRVTQTRVELENQSDFMEMEAKTVIPITACTVEKLPLIKVSKRKKLQLSRYAEAEYLPDGRLVTIDDGNNLCCLLDESFSVTADLKLPSQPSSLAVISNTEVAVALPSSKEIQVITVGQNLSFSRSIQCNRVPRCVARVSGTELAVGWKQGFGVIELDGKEKAFIQSDRTGRNISFGVFDRMAVKSDWSTRSRVYHASNGSSTVYCFGSDGLLHFKYSHADLRDFNGIGLDRDGNIYACSSSTDCIHQISPEGKRIGIISTMSSPYTVCFKPEGDEMIVMNSPGGVTDTILRIGFTVPVKKIMQ